MFTRLGAARAFVACAASVAGLWLTSAYADGGLPAPVAATLPAQPAGPPPLPVPVAVPPVPPAPVTGAPAIDGALAITPPPTPAIPPVPSSALFAALPRITDSVLPAAVGPAQSLVQSLAGTSSSVVAEAAPVVALPVQGKPPQPAAALPVAAIPPARLVPPAAEAPAPARSEPVPLVMTPAAVLAPVLDSVDLEHPIGPDAADEVARTGVASVVGRSAAQMTTSRNPYSPESGVPLGPLPLRLPSPGPSGSSMGSPSSPASGGALLATFAALATLVLIAKLELGAPLAPPSPVYAPLVPPA